MMLRPSVEAKFVEVRAESVAFRPIFFLVIWAYALKLGKN